MLKKEIIKTKKKARPESGRRVVVAMSGGIDSSVAAALLKEQGYEVVGVFMKFWSEFGKDRPENSCCTLESEKRARAVAKILKIPFYVFNFEKEFKKKVVDDFLAAYKSGVTPNPCVVCNKEIKFGLLLEKAMALGADFVATGHYARIKGLVNKINFTNYAGKVHYSLMKGRDADKDQSYFLWQLSQKQLKHILFPVGNYKKAEVKKMAEKFKLPVLAIPESQEICFAPDGINNFLTRNLEQKPGSICLTSGIKLGLHQGLGFYTIGQRKGINLSGGPYYVVDKDIKNNLLIVTKNNKGLSKKELIIKNVNLISNRKLKLPFRATVKIRYKNIPAAAKTYKIPRSRTFGSLRGRQDAKYKIQFSRSQKAITPGQSAVFYRNEELIGGGIISFS